MSYPAYGRVHVGEPPSALADLHQHDGVTPLKTSDHETPLGVLDQSDLLEQGIRCSEFIPGCKENPDALGSCTANATLAGLAAGILPEADWIAACNTILKAARSSTAKAPSGYSDTEAAEEVAIAFYDVCTHQTGTPSEEWPPEDCGSSGPYIVSELKRLGIIKGQKIATAGTSLLSLLQAGGALMGSPWFYSWEEPDAHGFIDGDGSVAAIEASINSGVAGGHETRLAAIEKIAFHPGTSVVDPKGTVIRGRNSWSASWGDHGCYRLHLSTLNAIGSACDFRQLQR